MKLLRTFDLDLLPREKREALTLRQTARAVVFDDDKRIALLDVQAEGFYKLPGGGVDPGEDLLTALKRECREEIGCQVEVDQEIGLTVEYRKRNNLRQESYCYLAHVVGKKGKPMFTDKELAQGFRVMWVTLDEAIALVQKANHEEYLGRFIVPRELLILRKAKKLVKTEAPKGLAKHAKIG